ncbi:MAG: purine-cytosine permease family protein [Candidatus Limnocylindria bacterium]
MATATVRGDESFAHDYAVNVIPAEKRRGIYVNLSVWVAWVISISAFFVGGAIGAGQPVAAGLGAVLLGNAILAIIAFLVGMVGFRTGLSSYMISRAIFGRGGSVIVSAVIGLLAMGFIGVLLDGFASAFDALLPGVPRAVAIVGFAVLVTFTAMFGYRGLAWLSRFAAPALLLLLVWAAALAVGQAGGLAALFEQDPPQPIPFSAAIGAVIATWITGAAIASDVTRYARSAWQVALGAFAAYVIGAGFFEGGSVIAAAGAGEANVVVYMSTLGLLLPAVLVLGLALWTTTDNNIYSTALAFTNAGHLVKFRLSKPVWTIVAVIIALLVSLLGFAGQFLQWLVIIATVTPPFAGVMIAHFWLLRFGRDWRTLASELVPEGFRWTALAAWLAASVIAYITRTQFIPALTGLLTALVLYTALELIFARQERVLELAQHH